MKKLMMVSVVLVVMVFVTGLVVAEEEAVQLEPQTTCPVMGGKINQELFADYEGKRVYFCCPGCPGKFNQDPEKYLEKLEAQGQTPEELTVPQTACPLLGGKIFKKLFADYEGKRVYFCCPGCVGKFKADPEKYIEQMEDQGITLDKTPKPQTTCPLMGGEINKKLFADYQGKRVYFCCPGCIEKFNADPEKYIEKLEAEGVTIKKRPGSEKEKQNRGSHGKDEHRGSHGK